MQRREGDIGAILDTALSPEHSQNRYEFSVPTLARWTILCRVFIDTGRYSLFYGHKSFVIALDIFTVVFCPCPIIKQYCSTPIQLPSLLYSKQWSQLDGILEQRKGGMSEGANAIQTPVPDGIKWKPLIVVSIWKHHNSLRWSEQKKVEEEHEKCSVQALAFQSQETTSKWSFSFKTIRRK